jgi:hypothetical protein
VWALQASAGPAAATQQEKVHRATVRVDMNTSNRGMVYWEKVKVRYRFEEKFRRQRDEIEISQPIFLNSPPSDT